MKEGSKKNVDFLECFNLYDYQSKASRYSYGLTYMKTRITTNQKHIFTKKKKERKELKHNRKENHQTAKGKTK